MTGATPNILRKENQNKHHTCQDEQGPQAYWSTHEEKIKLPAELPPTDKHQNNMCSSGLAVHHPDYETLQKYATGGCPVKTVQNWTKGEIHAVATRVPHDSDLSLKAIDHFTAEAKEKVASNQARLICYENLKVISQQK